MLAGTTATTVAQREGGSPHDEKFSLTQGPAPHGSGYQAERQTIAEHAI